MNERLKLMCVFAHPDDESLGAGGVLAKYAAEGVETYLVTATRGERGWTGDAKDDPGLEAMGKLRQAELRAAAHVLGLREVNLLDYIDGDLDQADAGQAISKIVSHLRRVRPQVVITFDPFGAYGHPDHIAISQFTTGAIVSAADPGFGEGNPHRVSKLYYMVGNREQEEVLDAIGDEPVMQVDGTERRPVVWQDWAITTRIDTDAHWHTIWRAIQCHQSQMASYQEVTPVLEQYHRALMGQQTFYRAMSLVNGGRRIETDLFEGLHSPEPTRAGVQMTEGLA